MNITEKYPELKLILDKCQEDAEKIVGKKVQITFHFKFQHLSTDMLATIICDVCEVKWSDIISESRKANIILARHIFCYLSATLQKKTLWQISNLIQRNDHGVIAKARDKVKRMIDTEDEIYMPAILEIEKRINEHLNESKS